MARLINDLNIKIIKKGASFAQKHLLNKGIKVLVEEAVMRQRRKWINCTIKVALLQCPLPKQLQQNRERHNKHLCF
jgi:hypothetical protein